MTVPFKSGFVAVVGRPNVGKSTLLNALIGEKVMIVSDKPQTTRNTVRCVLTIPNAQIVFLDTPGLHKPLHRLGEYMVQSAFRALADVDLVLWLVEMGNWTRTDEHILAELSFVQVPVILVLSKTDLCEHDQQEDYIRLVQKKREFAETVPVSALKGTNLQRLVDIIVDRLEEGPQYYPKDWLTDHPERFIIAEYIREELLNRTEEEIPYSIAVDVDRIKEDPEKNLMRIWATIYVEKESQKGIVIGKKGHLLKAVGMGARGQIEKLLGVQVYLNLWVKVKSDWRNKPGALRGFGYE